MKICFIAPANNYHTKKWCKWFSDHGHDVHVVSFIYDQIENANVHYVDTGASADSSDSQKLKYLLKAKQVKQIVNSINPDIVNVHYATSYGTVAALSGLKGYVLSVWGSDIYDFPKKSPFHKAMLKYSLKKAGYIFSTSNAMAKETHKYTDKKIEITPFGVDVDLFSPSKRVRKFESKEADNFIIGTVKALTPKYGIDYLLKATAIVIKEHPEIPIMVRIAGKGENEKEYKKMAEDLGISAVVKWLGFISQEDAAKEWANLDLAIVASTMESESFGVSAVEAQACGTPVIITDIPGLMEATIPNKTSIVIPRCDEYALAQKIVALYHDNDLRNTLGQNGRFHVVQNYELNSCFERIQKEFRKQTNNKK